MFPSILLREPHAFFEAALSARPRPLARLLCAGTLGASCFGAAMGLHVGGAHVAVTALKMPLCFLATLAVCFTAMHVVALAGGIGASARQSLTVALSGWSVTTLCLGALSPVVALFAWSAPLGVRSYLNLYALCAACGVVAGVFGAIWLGRGLRALHDRRATGVLIVWLFIYQFTGAQMAWVLRPWLGGADYSLAHGLSGNFYVGAGRVLWRWAQAA